MAFTRLSPKGLRLGQEVVEIQLTNLRGSPFADADGLVDSNTFCSSELYRQVGVGYIELGGCGVLLRAGYLRARYLNGSICTGWITFADG